MSASHPGGRRTTKCQGVGVATWRECSQGITKCCKPHSSQAKAHPKTLFISPSKPFLGASVDNIQKCKCSDGCRVRVVEYKCPWKHRDLHPKQAFLTLEIGGIQNGNKFALKYTSNYYFQVQLQMFVSGLTLCIFVVWTNKGIFTVEVPYDYSFMSSVFAKLEKFWTSQVLPFLITEVSTTSLQGKYLL